MKWFIDSMVGWWVLLLVVSWCAAAVVYELWLRGNIV